MVQNLKGEDSGTTLGVLQDEPKDSELIAIAQSADESKQYRLSKTLASLASDSPERLTDSPDVFRTCFNSDDPVVVLAGLTCLVDVVEACGVTSGLEELGGDVVEQYESVSAVPLKTAAMEAVGLFRPQLQIDSAFSDEIFSADCLFDGSVAVRQTGVIVSKEFVYESPRDYPKTIRAYVELLSGSSLSVAAEAAVALAGVVARDDCLVPVMDCVSELETLTAENPQIREFRLSLRVFKSAQR